MSICKQTIVAYRKVDLLSVCFLFVSVISVVFERIQFSFAGNILIQQFLDAIASRTFLYEFGIVSESNNNF